MRAPEGRQVQAPRASTMLDVPQLQPIRFGEFLRDRNLITEEQWLAALAEHWSVRRFTIGETIARHGYLAPHEIEREARAFHDLDVVEVDEALR